ncbi:MAG: VWA domain-containing protein [Alphaproteobacteria bacterium]|nr:VWA domain-containing protein [Alphaproteobacteria bacterium]
MISWGAPWAFLLLVPVLALPLQPWLTGVAHLVVPGPDTLEAGRTARRALGRLPRVLQVVGLVLVVIAFARPRHTQRTLTVESEGLDIMLAIDTSGSMRAEDFGGGMRPLNRLEVAKAVMAEFVEERPYDRIGVVAFGTEAFTHVPLTLDHDTLTNVLDTIQIGIAGEGSTAVGSAIAVSAKRLKDLDAPSRLVILLTDGRSNSGRLEPEEAARLAATLGIKVYTIGVGSARGRSVFGMGDGLDEATLERVAEITGARYFRATDTRTLQKVYDTIDELEPSPAEVEELVEHTELFRRFLVPGTLLLLLEALLRLSWLRRFP